MRNRLEQNINIYVTGAQFAKGVAAGAGAQAT